MILCFAGLLGEIDISVFSICFQVEGFAWMVGFKLSSRGY